MKTVYVLCEGPTEKQFVQEVLYDVALSKNIYLLAPVVTTKVADRKYYGGTSSYRKIRKDLLKLCNHSDAVITSLFDLYALPKDTPGYKNQTQNHHDWALNIEKSVNDDIGLNNLHFNLVVHEFEALLYANPSAFKYYSKAVAEMMEKAMLTSGGNPELINDCFDTSPSHRITQVYPEYSKPTVGVIISKRIGINTMREACPHFNEWLLFLGL